MQAVTKNILKFTVTGFVEGVILGWLLSLPSGNYFVTLWCGNARTFRRGDSRNCPSKRCLAVHQLTKNPHSTQNARIRDSECNAC